MTRIERVVTSGVFAVADGSILRVGGAELRVLHTPGHSPGGCCLHHGDGGVVFSGDTLFRGGPGVTGMSFSDFLTIIASIEARLLLPPDTVVHTGHGESTTIGDEAPHLGEWGGPGTDNTGTGQRFIPDTGAMAYAGSR